MSTNGVESGTGNPFELPPLHPSLFNPTDEERRFLRWAISPDDETVKSRVFQIGKEAYEVLPYPCIHAFHYTCLYMRENSVYNELLDLANKYPFRPILLDLGCLMGTDARNLIRDGYNKSGGQILACDLEQRFIDLGYKLYQDGPESTHPTPIRFFTGDIFKMSIAPPTEATEHGRDLPQNLTLDGVKGKLDFVYAGALFHLFDEPTQRDLAFRLARLIQMPSDSSGQLPDAIIFGRHAGLDEEGYISGHFVGGRWGQRYGHSPTSWVRLWKSIYTELYGHEWVEENIQANAVMQRINTKVKMLFWSVRIKRSYR